MGAIKNLIAAIEMPSGFVLNVSDDLILCGPIKESGLDQPISSILFRAGNLGLIGLIEGLGPTHSSPLSPMHVAQTQLANTFLPLLFPPSATRILPLVS